MQALKKIIQLIFISFLCVDSFAHEQWLLTKEQFAILQTKQKPTIFSELNFQNISILMIAILFCFIWYVLSKTKFGKHLDQYLIPKNEKSDMGAFILRICTAVTLYIAAFGIIPRVGNPVFSIPTLFVPDLELTSVHFVWYWLQWLELIVATFLLIGIYVRLMASILICMILVALFLFFTNMFAYLGYFLGISFYLLMQGGGRYALFPEILLDSYVDAIKPKALFILRIFTSLNFIYLGIFYKILQPNLTIGILEIQDAFTFGLTPETFAFCMAIVEIFSGYLLLTGVFIRPLVCILLILFIIVSFLTAENIFAHTFIYGILLTFLWNGPGKFAL